MDIIGYNGPHDLITESTFRNNQLYSVSVRRLNGTGGWPENLKVLINSEEILIGPSETNVKSVIVQKDYVENYTMVPAPPLTKLSRADFNQRFSTDIVVLPTNLYAVGVSDLSEGRAYIYNEAYMHWFQIELTINHLLSVILTKSIPVPLYFIICGDDGYMESHYPAVRDQPLQIGETEYAGKQRIFLDSENTYAVLHKHRTILGQNVQIGTAHTFAMPDRYYFCLNLFNQYRSYHRGLPFRNKISQIVYASNPRGSHFNFTKCRDILMPQREYFYSSAVPKTNVYVPGHIACHEMVNYKYLLDIDGWAGTWEATAWKLNSGSVILKTDSGWAQWFSDKYVAWVHYVPVDDNFGNLQEQFQWCETHTDECEAMIQRCQSLFQEVYRFSAVVEYVERVLRQLSAEQNSGLLA